MPNAPQNAPRNESGPDLALERVVAVIRALRDLADNDGLVCLDFIDLKVLLDDGEAPQRGHFGAGEAEGPGRARRAAEAALLDLRRHVAACREDGAPARVAAE